jgi:predicted naringenin-chalcone synthase
LSNIIAIATQNAPYKLGLDEMSDFVYGMNDDVVAKRKFGFLLRDNSIGHKYAAIPDFQRSCQTPVLYKTKSTEATTAARMQVFETAAVPLAFAACEKVLTQSNTPKNTITHIVTVTCTGLFAPGLEAVLTEKLALNPTIQRHSVNFMGCYAAFHGLRLADFICRADSDSVVLVVCVELCSLHFRKDSSDDNLLSTYLFSDGAAACIVANKTPKTPYLSCHKFASLIIPDGKKDMAWNIGNTGFEMVLKRSIAQHIERNIATAFTDFLAAKGLTQADIAHYAIHPGGKNILKAFERALQLPETDLAISHAILYEYGNMSSATILFVLEQFLLQKNQKTTENDKKWLYAAAFGPGLTVESGLFCLEYEDF